jgi:hypothetical protein
MRSQVSNYHTVPPTSFSGKYSYSSTQAKRLSGQSDGFPWIMHLAIPHVQCYCSHTSHLSTCQVMLIKSRNNMPCLDKHATRQLLLLVSHLLTAGKWTFFQDAHKCSIPTTLDVSTNDNCLKYTSDTWMLPSQGQHLGPSTPPCMQFYSSPSMVGSEPKCIPLLSCRLVYTLQGWREDLHTGCILMSHQSQPNSLNVITACTCTQPAEGQVWWWAYQIWWAYLLCTGGGHGRLFVWFCPPIRYQCVCTEPSIWQLQWPVTERWYTAQCLVNLHVWYVDL